MPAVPHLASVASSVRRRFEDAATGETPQRELPPARVLSRLAHQNIAAPNWPHMDGYSAMHKNGA
jgi:hypothetical protein